MLQGRLLNPVTAGSCSGGFTLQIAGACFRLTAPGPLPVAAPVAAYRSFVFPPDAAAPGPAAAVTLRRGTPEKPPRHAVPLLRSDDSWSLHRTAESCLIAMHGPGNGRPALWSARCSRDFREVLLLTNRTLRCGFPPRPHLLNCLQYPLDQLLLMHLLGADGLIVHAGAAVRSGRAVVFAGVSGAGKTTLARHLEESGFAILSDDRIVTRRDAGGYSAWGTPWPGEGGHARNEGFPIAAVLFLAKAPRNLLRRLEGREALARALPVLSVPWYDPELMAGPLAHAGALLASLPFYDFHFAPGARAADAVAALIDGPR